MKMMFDFTAIVWLLPIVFMLHEFEEIIFFKSWIRKHRVYLSERFPRAAKHFLTRFENMSVPAFTFAVAEEFVLLSTITVVSILFDSYLLWLGIFMGFFVHLFIHLIQWLILRRYIPAIYTAIISFIYCTLSLKYILSEDIFQTNQIIRWTFIGFGIVVLNLLLAHKLVELFEKYRK
jgi:hypothetical protein